MAVAVPVQTLAPGTTLGRYQLLHHLATGGMAEIYLARTQGIEGFEKLVVLKRILPHLAAREEFVAMFLDEARIAATLVHPNIAQVHDVGAENGSFFFTMELVQGEDARSVMRRSGGVPLEHALAIGIGAAAGLQAAHRKLDRDGKPMGIVHRDVSPSNLLVSYDGCVKLVDFGIAKAGVRHTETRTGTLKGKVHYMSPEQCKGEPLDGRSDVFALGIVLFELTTGRRPFVGESDYAIVTGIVSGEAPRPSSVKAGYPPDLEAIVLRALARDRERRFPTAEAMQVALEGFVRAHRLVVSSVALGGWMRALFADRIESWRRVLTPRARTVPPGPEEVVIQAEEPSARAAAVSTSMFDALLALAAPPPTPPPSTPVASRPPTPPLSTPVASEPPGPIATPVASEPPGPIATPVASEPPGPIATPVASEPPGVADPGRKRTRRAVVAGVILACAAALAALVWLIAHPRRSASAQEPALSAPAPGPTPVPVAEPMRPSLPAPEPSAASPGVTGGAPEPAEARERRKPSRSRPKRPSQWNLDSPLPP